MREGLPHGEPRFSHISGPKWPISSANQRRCRLVLACRSKRRTFDAGRSGTNQSAANARSSRLRRRSRQKRWTLVVTAPQTRGALACGEGPGNGAEDPVTAAQTRGALVCGQGPEQRGTATQAQRAHGTGGGQEAHRTVRETARRQAKGDKEAQEQGGHESSRTRSSGQSTCSENQGASQDSIVQSRSCGAGAGHGIFTAAGMSRGHVQQRRRGPLDSFSATHYDQAAW